MIPENSGDDGESNLAADVAISEQREYEKINEILNTLPSDVRRAFLMHRREELAYDKIAAQMNISTTKVEALITEAMKVIRTKLL